MKSVLEQKADVAKYSSPLLMYANEMSQYRAMVYALMCGSNGNDVTDIEMQAGCNRFGLDNPVPTVTKRLAWYGNEESIDKTLERVSKTYNFVDPNQYSDNMAAFMEPK